MPTVRLRNPRRTNDEGIRPAAGSPPHTRRIADVWLYSGGLAVAGALVYVFLIRGLPQNWGALHLPLPALAALFCAAESWRVYIHFRRNAQSFALSEIPLVVGLFFATPDELVAARLLGAAVGLTLIRRHPPIKLLFNLAMFVLEAELTLILFNLLPTHDVSHPIVWLFTLLILAAGSMLGFVLTSIAITLAEEGVDSRQRLQAGAITLVGCLANTSLGLEVVTAVSRHPVELWLLITPLIAISAAYALYTREHSKRQQLQYLYQSSDLLQRATADSSAIPELLAQLCHVFRAEVASVTLLPVATSSDSVRTVVLRRGVCTDKQHPMGGEVLEHFAPLLDERHHGIIASSAPANLEMRGWLHRLGIKDAMATTLQSDGTLLGALTVGNRLSDVSTFTNDDLELFDTFAAQTSVAVQNTRLDHRLKKQAFHDPITDLANRALFMDRLEHALARRERMGDSLAVMFMDLDDFKMINDSLGHAAGDELLRHVADRLQLVLRPADTAARFGGDEFAVLLEDTIEAYDVIRVAERIVSVLKPRFVVAGREVTVHASVGVAVTTTRDLSSDELVRRADVAMYRAKMKGKGRFEVFEPSMQEVATRRLEVRTDLERALDRGELALLYQPVVDITSSTPIGVEALVRWNHPSWGVVAPGEFIGVAEETGLISELGMFVLEEACRQCQEWHNELIDQPPFSMSVNVSPRQLRDPNFVSDVWRALTRTGLHPSHLILEITENFMVESPENAGDRLRELKALGVRISIDDFGTGYSSLAMLQDLPIDILKIDKAFVDHIADDPRRTAFAQAIIRLGKTLGLELVAEGVETRAQSERLSSLGCRIAQGYFFSKPVQAEEIRSMLRTGQAMRSWGDPPADIGEDGELTSSVVVLPTDAAGGELGRRAAEKRRLG
jgi:diguanylate cyclase (GGDEF)-like protein